MEPKEGEGRKLPWVAQELLASMRSPTTASSPATKPTATTEEVNAIQYGKLMLAAHVGVLCSATSAAQRGAKGGRGKKAPKHGQGAFSEPTLADYRKLARQQADAVDARRS